MKLILTKPAILAAIAYFIMALVILLPFNNKNITNTPTYDLKYRSLLLLLMLIPILLSIYSINCFVVGKCYVWSWVNAIVLCLWVILFITATFISNDRLQTLS